jgi:hypothetical protein
VAYEHKILNVIDTAVFVNDHVLGCVLRAPLANSVVYNLCQLITFPTRVKNSQNTFIIIGSDKDYLLWTRWKKMSVKLSELYASATERPECKHVFPLKFTILDLECEAILTGPTEAIPSY